MRTRRVGRAVRVGPTARGRERRRPGTPPGRHDPARATLSDAPPTRGALRFAGTAARPHVAVLLAGVGAAVVAGLLTVAGPVLVGRVVDALLTGGPARAVVLALVALAAALAQTVAAGAGRAALVRAGERTVRDLRDRVLDRLTTVPLRFLERHRAGDLLQRATAQVASLSGFVRDVVPELVLTGGTVAVTLVVLGTESWVLLVVLVAAYAPAAGWLLHRFRRAAPAAFAAEAAAESHVGAEVAEAVRVRPLLAGGPPAARRLATDPVDDAGDRVLRAQLRTVVLGRWIHAMGAAEAVTLAGVALAGTALVAADAVSVGVVVTFVLAGRSLFAGFADLSALVADVQGAVADLARTSDLMGATAPVPATPAPGREVAATPAPGPVPPAAGRPGADRALVVDRAAFAYDDGPPVLRDVSLRVEAGHRVVVVGRTGAGKSTLLKVLTGLYAPDAGRVTCAGVDLHALPAEDRAALVALVPQAVHLAPGTVGDDLRLVRPHASDDDLRARARATGLGAWLTGLPRGLATPTDRLSAGERQLVALLRAVLLDPAVLVLDEATSDVDPVTADLVESAVDRLTADRAVVVVAHRLDTVARWGRVHELVGGVLRAVDAGPAAPAADASVSAAASPP